MHMRQSAGLIAFNIDVFKQKIYNCVSSQPLSLSSSNPLRSLRASTRFQPFSPNPPMFLVLPLMEESIVGRHGDCRGNGSPASLGNRGVLEANTQVP